MLVDASQETELLAGSRQVLNRPERHDSEFESSGKLEIRHVSVNQSDAVAYELAQSVCLGTASCEHVLGVIESCNGTTGFSSSDEDAAGTATKFEQYCYQRAASW
jgi:hypothetical protein